MVKGFEEWTWVEEGLDSIDNIWFDNGLEFMKEEGRNTIWSRSFVRPQLEHCIFYLHTWDEPIEEAALLIR